MEQETFIYIDEKEKYDASVVANTFIDNSVKNRVYINTLGAELGMKYLNSENIDTSGLKNMHSIKKVIGEFDIADIMLKGIHIDVRVVFDENAIFVPKSHFEYNILPDIYLVFKIEKEQSRVRFLGFFEPKLINKNNANKDYYFIEKEKLNSALDLLQYIEKHKFSNDINLSENEIESAENLIISMADNDISDSDKKHLLEQLIKSIELRDKFIEYENFETLSYKAMSDSSVDKHSIAKDVTPIDEFAEFEDTQAVDNTDDIAETLEINEEINNDTESVEQITEEEQEFFTDNLEGIDSLQENDIELQNDNFEAMQENINSEGFDLDDAIETLGASAGAEAGVDSIIDSTSVNAQELIENASDIAEDLVDLASDNAESIINDAIQEDNLNFMNDVVSIDSVDVDDNIEEISENNIEKIDLPEEHEIENKNFDISEIQGDAPEEAGSFEAIFPEDVFMDNDKAQEGTIALENIDVPELPDENEDFQLDLDDENLYLDNFPEEKPDLNMEDSISLEDIDDSHVGGANAIVSFGDIDNEDVEDLIIDSDESAGETFGKNLMENLTENEMDNVLIDGIDSTMQDTDVVEQSAADDLLTQIDDVIDTASLSDVPLELNDTNEDVNLDLHDTTLADNSLSETEIINSDTVSTNTADTQLEDILLETPSQTEELIAKSEENVESLDLLDEQASTAQENIADIVEPNIELSEIPELSNTILDEEQAGQDIETLVEQKQEVHEETVNSITDVPQDYIEDLLDPVNVENIKSSTETESDGLNVLYTEDEASGTDETQQVFDDIDELEEFEADENAIVPETAIINQKKQQNNNSKILIIAAIMLGLIAAATVFYFVKPKDNNVAEFEPLPNNPKTTLVNNDVLSADANAVDTKKTNYNEKIKTEAENKTTENILKTNAPDVVKKSAAENKKQAVKELKNTQSQKPITSTAYMSVSKIVWDVPDNLSYSARMQNYLRTTGKSIKLTLSTDLLLATEYAYADSVKTGITIGKDGSVQTAKILASSGSSQIDNIVLQSVKETLNAIKPPTEDVKGKEFNLNLIIYF